MLSKVNKIGTWDENASSNRDFLLRSYNYWRQHSNPVEFDYPWEDDANYVSIFSISFILLPRGLVLSYVLERQNVEQTARNTNKSWSHAAN